ncbi:MAG: putative essential recombination function protein [Prokaryotic dsDNA virus sp.]|nr:MAG: putative essential recombination function protein [Prokaryotic dsDNA virus sp.]|tara:strand:+ start:362 stop:871 length:510 start_codon:yes stop_codon:yes gene_type:complete
MKETNVNIKLFNLQQEIGTISKDAKNPFYKSKYFDINSLIKQLQPLLKKHKLLLLQPIEEDCVYSKLICIDGTGGVISALKLPEISDPQKLGSCITYYRRYTLASLLGLQAVDDDANVASGVTVDKKWLNQNTPEYSKAIEFIKGGGSVEAIKSKYKVSGKIENELAKL